MPTFLTPQGTVRRTGVATDVNWTVKHRQQQPYLTSWRGAWPWVAPHFLGIPAFARDAPISTRALATRRPAGYEAGSQPLPFFLTLPSLASSGSTRYR